MKSRSNAIFAGILGLAVLATIVLFLLPHFMKDAPDTTGKMSVDVVKVESEYKDLQKEWKENEKAFLAAGPEMTQKLTHFQERFQLLAKRADALKGRGEEEKSALPHLVASIHSSSEVLEPFVMKLINPAMTGPKTWEKAKAAGEKANEEWSRWQEATRALAR